jgi:hypothetical protein
MGGDVMSRIVLSDELIETGARASYESWRARTIDLIRTTGVRRRKPPPWEEIVNPQVRDWYRADFLAGWNAVVKEATS